MKDGIVDGWCKWWLLGNGWRNYSTEKISEFQVGIGPTALPTPVEELISERSATVHNSRPQMVLSRFVSLQVCFSLWFIFQACPDIDVNLRNGRQQTALLLAVDKRHVAITKLLLEKGAHVNWADEVGDSPLHVVVMYHSLKTGGSNVSKKEVRFYQALSFFFFFSLLIALVVKFALKALGFWWSPVRNKLTLVDPELAPISARDKDARAHARFQGHACARVFCSLSYHSPN